MVNKFVGDLVLGNWEVNLFICYVLMIIEDYEIIKCLEGGMVCYKSYFV